MADLEALGRRLKMTGEDAFRIVAADARRRRLSGMYSPEMCRQLADIEEAALDQLEGSSPSVN